MKTAQTLIRKIDFGKSEVSKLQEIDPHLIMGFGAIEYFENKKLGSKLKGLFPRAHVMGCSTAGEISDSGVSDNSLVLMGVHFQKAKINISAVRHTGLGHTMTAGEKLAAELKTPDLKGVFVLAQGVNINGSSLIQGIQSKVPKGTIVTGGLAGDGGKFKSTMVMCNDQVGPDLVAGVGFSGKDFSIQFGSFGGWEAFGNPMKVTKAIGNLLMELDGKPALDVYKSHLGAKAKDLPGSGLLFPFAILDGGKGSPGLIRTLLGVNEANKSLVLAGDMPNNATVSMMKAQNENLVKGAESAAKKANEGSKGESFSVLISCVGRKLVMGSAVDGEVKAVRAIMGKTHVAGFYSYGEICPQGFVDDCKLHNQTMTITQIGE